MTDRKARTSLNIEVVMEVSGASEMQVWAHTSNCEMAVLKKSIDMDKDMAAQLIDAIPKDQSRCSSASSGKNANLMERVKLPGSSTTKVAFFYSLTTRPKWSPSFTIVTLQPLLASPAII